MLNTATANFSWMSDAELDARLEAMAVDLAVADAKFVPGMPERKRSRRVFRGVILTVTGVLFAAQTSGLTLLLCVTGVADIIDVIEDEAATRRLQVQLRDDLERYKSIYERIVAEKERRDW